jgi:hypothetical protein
MADSIEIAFRKFFIANIALTPTFGDRYHLNKLPDTPQYPCVRETTITDAPKYHHQGVGPQKTTIQLDVIHTDKVSCNVAADKIIDTLSGYRGTVGDYRVRIFVKNVPSSWESELRYFRRILEMEIGYAK